MNLYQLRYFSVLARMQHYGKAAEKLCIAQPSLSHAISQLEQELGVRLFERKGRSTSLTSAGEQFLTFVNKSLAILDNGISAMEHISRGEGCIKLGFIRPLGTHFIPEIAADFQKRQPSLDIHFEFHTDSSQPLLSELCEGIYDMVFCTRLEQESSVDFFPVAHQDLVLIVPKGHPLSGLSSIDLSATLSYPHICFTQDSGLRSVVDELFKKIGQFPQIAYEIQEDQVIAGLVARNFGIAVIPYMEELSRMNLDIIQISRPVWERNFYLATLKNRVLSPAAQNFYDYVTTQYASNPALTDLFNNGENSI